MLENSPAIPAAAGWERKVASEVSPVGTAEPIPKHIVVVDPMLLEKRQRQRIQSSLRLARTCRPEGLATRGTRLIPVADSQR